MRRRRTVTTRSKASSSTSPSTPEASAPADPAGPLPDLLAGLRLGPSGPSATSPSMGRSGSHRLHQVLIQLPDARIEGLPEAVTSRSAHIPLASLPPTSDAM